MNLRHSAFAVGFAVALSTPLAAFADVTWETTYDEPGSRIVAPQFGTIARTAPLPIVTALQPGDVSQDRQYIFLGEEAGWALRPMQFAFENGRLVHVDDPAGHMSRVADTRPLSDQQRLALERSAGR